MTTSWLSEREIKLPEHFLPKAEMKKLGKQSLKNYYYGLIKSLFEYNRNRGFSTSEISDILNIAPTTIQSHLLQLMRERKIYEVYAGKRILYRLNGRIAHKISSATFNFGSKYYEITAIMNEFHPTFLLKEQQYNALGELKIIGGLEIEGPFLDQFIEKLHDLKTIMKEEANDFIEKEIKLK